ncbi:hypothetical protein DY000_02029968 [Brassica cretica]|uniref:Uncharacterized protein n=1 Tax=Brassica cretica TaxID=69181 RepID=A0ABQ7DXE7_BRACR|nr:hypothetical protein DY000_02029968 [Brassica cretica]
MHTEEFDEDYEEERATEDYSIGSWADDHHHGSYAVDTSYCVQGADELHEGFTYEELLNMQRHDETYQKRAEAVWGRSNFSHSIDRAIPPSIDINPSTSIDISHTTSIDIRPKPKPTVSEKDKSDNQYLTPDEFGIFSDPDGYAKAIDGRTLHVSREDIADILQTANEADNLFMRQHIITKHQQKVAKEFYDTAGGMDKSFKHRSQHPTQPSIDVDVSNLVDRRPEFGSRDFDLFGTRKLYWKEKDEYEIYRDDQGYARDGDGHTIRVHNKDIRRLLERASRDEPNYICLPEHASSFTQTKLVPEIYTKDEINEMFYGICREQEKNKEDFQMKLDGVYYPLNDSISWLTTCMEEMRQDIAIIQRANDVSRSILIDRHRQASIDSHLHASTDNRLPALVDDNRLPASVDDNPPHSHTRCDDIYFPMDLSISALTSKKEAIQGELVEIQSYIARRPEASASPDRSNNISTDIRRQTLVDDATNRGRLIQKVTSDMFDTHNNGEENSANTYATVMRHQFNLESLGDRLQKKEDATTIMKDKWRRGDEAMQDFTGPDTCLKILAFRDRYSQAKFLAKSKARADLVSLVSEVRSLGRRGVEEAKRHGGETYDLDDTGFQISISLAKIPFVDDGGDEMSMVSRVYAERGLTELRFVSGWVWRVQSGFKRTSCKRLSWRLRSSGDVVDDFFGSRRPRRPKE